MPPIAILCNSSSWGGLEINTFRLAHWLTQGGKSVVLFCPPATPIYTEAIAHNLQVEPFVTNFKYADVAGAFRLKKLLAAHKIKVLIIPHSKDINVAVLAKLVAGYELRLIYIQHMQLGIAKKDFIHTFLYKRLAAWVTPLESLKKQVIAHTKIAASKVHVIPLGIELDKFAQAQAYKSGARKLFGLPPHDLLIGIIGRIDAGKGQLCLVQAIHKLKAEGIQVHGLIVGESTKNEPDNYELSLKATVATLGLGGQIHFRPFTTQPEMAYAALDIFVMASADETYGMVTIEAMAAGLPIIGTKAGGTAELLQDETTGLFFKPADDTELALAIKRLINDPALAARLGANAGQEANLKYSHMTQCDKMEALIEHIVGTDN